MKNLALIILATFLAISSSAQIVEVALSDRINESSTIVEGKVISQFSFWDDNMHNIYTASQIEVYKVLDGSVSGHVEIITPGGTVGMHREVVEPSLELRVGDLGVFVMHNNHVPCATTMFGTSAQFQPVASVQGFLRYNIHEQVATDGFSRYTNLETDIYNVVEAQVGHPYSTLSAWEWADELQGSFIRGGAPVITGFVPTTATAGTATTITISGTDFGVATGTVRFSDADDGGATFVDGLTTEIISWNNTTIVVEVYSGAGTGPIQIETGFALTATSADDLTVTYAQLNPEFDPGTGTESYQTRHVDRDGSGGYVWQMFTDFDANTAANDAFVRALDTWRCTTGINWTIGTVTTTDVIANDNINIIRHDNGGELPGGVLGRCTSRWSGCGGATIEWYVEELDIVFDDGTNWNYSTSAPGGSEYDFESVCVHELGHGHQLGHVINTNQVMHYAISNGEQQRSPSVDEYAGANDVQSRSEGGSVCSQTVMSAYSCGSAPVADFSASATTVCEGTSITFTDASTNTPTDWSWNFGGGGTPNTSSLQNPSITFSSAGTYTITLTATNASGSDDEVKTNYITVTAAPSGSASITNVTPCNGGTNGAINLNPSGGTSPYTFDWDNDGTGDFDDTEDLTGLPAGNYNVTIRDANSCEATLGAFGVTEPSVVTYTVGITNETCTTNDGELAFTGSGGDGGPYTYSLDGGAFQASGTFSGLTAGNYTIDVEDASGCASVTNNETVGDDCVSATTQLRSDYCPYTASSMVDKIFVDPLASATIYRYRFVPQGGGTTLYKAKSATSNWLGLDQVYRLEFLTTYDVSVSAYVGGSWGPYGPVCEVTTPALPTWGPSITPAYCGHVMSTWGEVIYITWPPAGTATLEYQFTPVGGGPTLTYIRGKSNYMKPKKVPGIQASTTYDVVVRPRFFGSPTPVGVFGSSCQITTPSYALFRPGGGDLSSMSLFEDDATFRTEEVEQAIEVTLYPNPTDGNMIQLSFNLDPNMENDISVDIYDLSGRALISEQYTTSVGTGYYNTLIDFSEQLTQGVYLVNVTVNSESKTKKLVVK